MATGSGLGFADTGDDGNHDGAHSSHESEPGSGNGLSGGPTDAQVFRGALAVPLSDPTLGEGTVLPPVYNSMSNRQDLWMKIFRRLRVGAGVQVFRRAGR
jgi:hypothetical protein